MEVRNVIAVSLIRPLDCDQAGALGFELYMLLPLPTESPTRYLALLSCSARMLSAQVFERLSEWEPISYQWITYYTEKEW